MLRRSAKPKINLGKGVTGLARHWKKMNHQDRALFSGALSAEKLGLSPARKKRVKEGKKMEEEETAAAAAAAAAAGEEKEEQEEDEGSGSRSIEDEVKEEGKLAPQSRGKRSRFKKKRSSKRSSGGANGAAAAAAPASASAEDTVVPGSTTTVL